MSVELDASPQDMPEPASGLDAILDKAIAADEAKGQEPRADAPSTETAEEREARRGNPYRDESGKFTTKPAEDGAAPADGSAALPEAKTDAETNKESEPAPQPLEPHPRWSEADKVAFAKLPPDGQSLMLDSYKRMEADYTRKTQELAGTRNAVAPFVESLTKWSPYFQELGVAPSQAFDNLLSVEYTLRHGRPEEKRQIIDSLERDYAVPPSSATAKDPNQAESQEWVDPAVINLSQQLAALSNELHGFKTEQQQRALQGEYQAAQAEFSAIGQAKNQDGSSRYPHFERVKGDMVDLVSNGRAETWDAAYDKAVRLDDDLFKQTVAERERKALEAEDKRRKEAVDRARGVTPPAKTSPAVGGVAKPKGLDALLSATLDKAGLSSNDSGVSLGEAVVAGMRGL